MEVGGKGWGGGDGYRVKVRGCILFCVDDDV